MEIVRKGKSSVKAAGKTLDEAVVRAVKEQASAGAEPVKQAAKELSNDYKDRIKQIKDKQLQDSAYSDFEF